eukprot:4506479-Prymnesium_polylepis.1
MRAPPEASGEEPGHSSDLWANVAATELHWFRREAGLPDAWLSRDRAAARNNSEGEWRGWTADAASPIVLHTWRPWSDVLDASEAPFVRWFCGGLTNAALNECDRHVLRGHGAEVAFISEGGDSCSTGGMFGDVCDTLTRHDLLARSVVAARSLSSRLELRPRDRLALLLPNGLE